MRRVALEAGWLAAGYAGVLLTVWLQQRFAPAPAVLVDAVYFAPLLLLIAALVRDPAWLGIILAGFVLLAVTEHFLSRPLAQLLNPVTPGPGFVPPPRSEYLPLWLKYYGVIGLAIGLIEVAVLWPYLRPAWMWPVYKVIAGAATAFALYWQVTVPMPGAPAGTRWDWVPAVVGALGAALTWRFGATAPRLSWRLPLGRRAGEDTETAYAAWVHDLESSIESSEPM